MDVLRHHDNVDPVYFSPLSSPALERFPQGTGAADARHSQSMVGLSTLPPNRRPDTIADGQRNPRRTAPYSPVARATLARKRNSITSLNLTNGSPSEHSSDSVSPEPLPSSSMPPRRSKESRRSIGAEATKIEGGMRITSALRRSRRESARARRHRARGRRARRVRCEPSTRWPSRPRPVVHR